MERFNRAISRQQAQERQREFGLKVAEMNLRRFGSLGLVRLSMLAYVTSDIQQDSENPCAW